MRIRMGQEGFVIGPRIGVFLWFRRLRLRRVVSNITHTRGRHCNLLEKKLSKILYRAVRGGRRLTASASIASCSLPVDLRPNFHLVNQKDEKQDLAALRGHPVLVYFYPRADTPGCTQQACGLRDIAGASRRHGDPRHQSRQAGGAGQVPRQVRARTSICCRMSITRWQRPTGCGRRRRTTARRTWGSCDPRS